MMTDLTMKTSISWNELKDLEFHEFKNIYQHVADILRAEAGIGNG